MLNLTANPSNKYGCGSLPLAHGWASVDFDTRRAWIWAYLENNFEASAVNHDFHEKYHAAFPRYARRETMWGAQPVSQAMSDLRRMRKEGSLESKRICLGGGWQPGFPRWVDGFRIAEVLKESRDDKQNDKGQT